MESCGVSSADCRVHLVGVNRLSACREFFGVHSWQNGTRCRDGVNVLWCHSHLVWLVFEGSIPTYACSENFLVIFSMVLRAKEANEKPEVDVQKAQSLETC